MIIKARQAWLHFDLAFLLCLFQRLVLFQDSEQVKHLLSRLPVPVRSSKSNKVKKKKGLLLKL